MPRLRILFLCNTPPLSATSGAVIQTYHFMRLLSDRHEIGVWAISNEDYSSTDFGVLGEKLSYRSFIQMPKERPIARRWAWLSGRNPMARWGYHGTELEESLRRAIEEFRPDIVQCEQLHVAHFFMSIKHIATRPKLVFNAHDAIYVVLDRSSKATPERFVLKRLLNAWFVESVRRMEQRVVRKSDLVCCVSEEDARSLQLAEHAKRYAITPNGVDTDYFSPLPEPEELMPTIIFVGSMNYAPNTDAIEFYMSSMHESLLRDFPALKLLVVGAHTAHLQKYRASPGVEWVGFQSDIRPFFARACASIVPLRSGSGTRFKILESWAMKRPVVSTSIGAEGLPFVDNQNILIANSPDRFRCQIATLIADAAVRNRLAVAGRRLVEEHFSWQRIVAELDRSLVSLLQNPVPPDVS